MMTKQERFKKLLAGDYNTRDSLDVDMSAKMTILGWTGAAGLMKFEPKPKFNSIFSWVGDKDWNNDIKIILHELNDE